MNSFVPNIRHLIAFNEVARLQRVGLASERVHLSQPAITQAIAKLEKAFGSSLFDRRPKGMFLTEVGAILNGRTERLLQLLQQGHELALRRAPRSSNSRGRRDFYKLATQVQLQALVAVAKAGSFSQAARDLGAKQPAVHRAARDLESLASIELFQTVRRSVELTPSGEVFTHHVQLAAAEWRQARYEIDAYLGKDSTRIVVGSLPLSRSSLLPNAIDKLLRASGKGLQIQCIEAPYPSLLRDLRTGEIDFIIGALRHPVPSEDITQEPLFSDQLALVARADHPLHGRRHLTLQDTVSYPWIAPPKQTPSGSFLFNTLRIQDMPETPVRIVSSSMVLVRNLMLRGDYITIMSPNQFEFESDQGLLAALPIRLENSARQIGFAYRRDWKPTATQSVFLDLIRQNCSNER